MIQLLSLFTIALAANNPEFVETQLVQSSYETSKIALKSNSQFVHWFTASDQTGIKNLENGLKYKILREGHGKLPSKNDFIKTNYTVSLLNGKILGTSTRKNAPALLEVATLPKGLQQIVTQMKAGSHWVIYIPAELAYGDKGYHATIPPNSPLIFDLELVNVKNPPNEEVTSVIEEFQEKD